MQEKVLLIILDGFGLSDKVEGNAVKAAKTPFINSLYERYPHCRLKTNGRDVGLPSGIMGNSEVGHLNIGAGRIVYQLNTLIDHKIETGEFFENQALITAIDHAKSHNSKVHLFGLLSNGGVHSSLAHLDAILELCKRQDFARVYYHAFMDGRDTLPHAGGQFVKEYCQKAKEMGRGEIATICGRFYAMDRDNRWKRVEKAYNMLVNGEGEVGTDPVEVVEESYKKNITDEFILPTVIHKDGKPLAVIEENDAIIFFNFRSDRPREITKCFIYPDFAEFPVKEFHNLEYVTMTEYDAHFNSLVSVAFRNPKLVNILGQVIQDSGLKQLRLAETEKYAHVTFFFNGGVEEPFQNEDRILVDSPKIASYDLQPEMSAPAVTEKAITALKEKDYELIIINFANCDMVGHTGVFDAVVKAVETVDGCLSQIVPLAVERGYHVLVSADHGNAEQMLDDDGNVMTAHSMNEVPFFLITPKGKSINLTDGKLGDIAPTLLYLMDIEVPDEMTGDYLITNMNF